MYCYFSIVVEEHLYSDGSRIEFLRRSKLGDEHLYTPPPPQKKRHATPTVKLRLISYSYCSEANLFFTNILIA